MSKEKGHVFCELVRHAISKFLSREFETEVSLPVGAPPHPHKFDLATRDRTYVGEVKAFTWTAGNNTPSAKIATIKEALQFLHALDAKTKTFVVLQRHVRPSNPEPLAEYFVRLHGHWLAQTTVLELDVDSGCFRVVLGKLV
jgi:hypothetical protein